jgi:hypothetical protein
MNNNSWEGYINTLILKSRLKSVSTVETHLIKFAKDKFKELNVNMPYITSPFEQDVNMVVSMYGMGAYMPMSSVDKRAYINTIANEVITLVKEELIRIEKEGAKLYNIKIIDRVYNPLYNKIGYTLEDGSIVFTDEVVTESTHEVNTDNFMRKVTINSILK